MEGGRGGKFWKEAAGRRESTCGPMVLHLLGLMVGPRVWGVQSLLVNLKHKVGITAQEGGSKQPGHLELSRSPTAF